MKIKTWLFLCGCIVLAGLVITQINLAGAKKSVLKDTLKYDSSVPMTSDTAIPNDSNSIPLGGNERLKSDDVLKDAERLIRNTESVYLTAGWLHISSQTESFISASTVMPDGSPVPAKWTDDLWVYLDENGNAIKAVSIQDTGSQSTSQISVFEKGIWTNLSLGISSSEPETYKPGLDSGFFGTVLPYKDSVNLDEYQEVMNGQNVVIFMVTERYEKPVKILKDTQEKKAREISGVVFKYYFSLDTGLPVQIEDYFLGLDGNMEISQRISNIRVEKIDRPSDLILNYFSN
ncbi:MAG: hypothetical protein AB1509_00395 [Chloroflexota bacterium]